MLILSASTDPAGVMVNSTTTLPSIFLRIVLVWKPLWLHMQADHISRIGEVVYISLPDGSELALNSNSAITLDFTENHRQIHLLKGEVFVKVFKDPQNRPFRVFSQHGQALALGTEFIVREYDKYSILQVLESQVAITAASQQAQIGPGTQIKFNRQRLQKSEPAAHGAGSWRQQQLVFINRPLTEVLAEIQRYRIGYIYLDSSLNQADTPLRFTGRLSLNNTDLALETVARALNLQLQSYSPLLIYMHSAKN